MGIIFIFHLNKLWKAKFFGLHVVFLLRLRGEIWSWLLLSVRAFHWWRHSMGMRQYSLIEWAESKRGFVMASASGDVCLCEYRVWVSTVQAGFRGDVREWSCPPMGMYTNAVSDWVESKRGFVVASVIGAARQWECANAVSDWVESKRGFVVTSVSGTVLVSEFSCRLHVDCEIIRPGNCCNAGHGRLWWTAEVSFQPEKETLI